MVKLKDFFRSKSGKIAICVIAAIIVAASIGAIITIKHKKIDNNKIAETKKEQTLDTKKAAAEEEKSAEKELEKAKAKFSKAHKKAENPLNKVKGTKPTNSSANERNSANKPSKPSNGGSNKLNKPSKQKETLTQEIARLKKWVWESTPNAVFLPKQYSENDDYEADVEAYARSKGVRSYGYSEIKLSNGKYIPYFWKH